MFSEMGNWQHQIQDPLSTWRLASLVSLRGSFFVHERSDQACLSLAAVKAAPAATLALEMSSAVETFFYGSVTGAQKEVKC